MNADLAALAYLVSGILFILALRGLSSPASSRAGNRNGMIGMAIAAATTLWVVNVVDALTWGMIIAGVAVGGSIGAVIARRIAMTAMPQLVAAFHSLVGLASVLVAGAALYSPQAYGIGFEGAIRMQSLIEMSLGVTIGAITFAAVAPAQYQAKGGKIEVHLDSPTGALLGLSEPIRPTDDQAPLRLRTTLRPTSGVHDVYFLFTNPDAKGDGFLFGVLTATFESAPRSGAP